MSELDLDALEQRYTRTPVPPCRVCGGELTPQSMGGGRPTVYAHSTPDGVSWTSWQAHYQGSRWEQPRSGDSDVLAAIARIRDLETRLRLSHYGHSIIRPEPAEQPSTIGDIRRAIDGLPDEAQAFINISGHSEDYAIDDLYPSEQIPVGAPWPTDKRTIGLEIHLGLFTEHPPQEEDTDG